MQWQPQQQSETVNSGTALRQQRTLSLWRVASLSMCIHLVTHLMLGLTTRFSGERKSRLSTQAFGTICVHGVSAMYAGDWFQGV
jgi:hypothetical protein